MALREGTDAHLVARAREGDEAALDRLIARHRSRLFGIARHMTGSADAAQDIVQEALVSALTSLSCLRDGNSFGKWLNTIVRRQVLRWRRERGRWPEPAADLTLRGAPAAVWDRPEVASPELLESIRDALEVLKRRDRQVMILHYLEGRTCEEIAAIVGLSQGGVKRILHDSRNRVRQECEEMSETPEEVPSPRRLRHWIAGSVLPERANVFHRLKHRLAQAVCLSVNKRPKTVKQIAGQVGAHADYVADTVQDLAEIEVLESPGKRAYLANFIALDGEDWRRLTKFVPEPAGEAAKRLAAAEDRLRGAFERTQLAATGWEWSEVAWVIYAVLTANMGVSHTQPDSYHSSAPKRPDGGRYWLGGCEEAEHLPTLWSTGLNSFGKLEHLEVGYWWSWGVERERPTAFSAGDDAYTALAAFREGPLAEAEVIGRLGGEAEHWQQILAHLIKDGVLRRANGEIRAGIPIFTRQESDVLTDEVSSVMAPITREVVEPALARVPEKLDKMGYGHRREQYPQWQRWLAGDIMGEALRFLMEQGVLPRPPRPAPASFAMLAWDSGIPLMLP